MFSHGNVVNDGEFWIEWTDFVKNFSKIYICHSKIEDVVQLKVLVDTFLIILYCDTDNDFVIDVFLHICVERTRAGED